MRVFLLTPFVILGLVYFGGALFFAQHEQKAQVLEEIDLNASPQLRHPEETLGAIRGAFASNNFSPVVFTYVQRSVGQIPSFYQALFLLASYYESRIEEPVKIRQGYEAALRRYPTNGRLHLSYSQWLMDSRLQFPGLPIEGSVEDAYRLAEEHLKEALRLEPDLTLSGLDLLKEYRVVPERWSELVPDGLPARRQLFHALARAGYRHEALALLREMIDQSPEPELHREAANLALQWGDPVLALESAHLWQEAAANESLPAFSDATLQLARVYLAQGEKEAAYMAFRQGLKEIEARSSASSPSGLELLCGMATEYLGRGQTVMAESLFAEASTLAPYHAPAFLGLARTYRRAGDRNAAIEQYQKVLQLDPENARVEKELAPLILERELSVEPR